MRTRFLSLALMLPLLTACVEKSTSPCPGVTELAQNSAAATVDNNPYQANQYVTWELLPMGLFITLPPDGDISMTVTAQTTDQDLEVASALEGALPITINLGDRATDGGDLTVTDANGSTNSKDGGGGTFWVTQWDGTLAGGCFNGSTPASTVADANFLAVAF